MMFSVRSLLILSCSKKKKNLSRARAVDIYDGPSFRILRHHFPMNLDALVLSAKYGLIEGSTLISPYDLKMTLDVANEMRSKVTKNLIHLIINNNYQKIAINLGKTYMQAIDLDDLTKIAPNMEIFGGGIGARNHQLLKWLTTSVEMDNYDRT